MLLLALPLAAQAASFCLDTARHPPPPRALAMAAAAQREHRAFGGQAMDAEGRLTESGLAEAEDVRATRFSPAPWQRVLGYWGAVDFKEGKEGRLPLLVRFGALLPADRRLLIQALNQASTDHLQGLGVGPDQGLQSHELRAARTAIDRVAVIDTPWSAAFVSWLAREAGLSPQEFEFSDAHADYAGAAWQAGSAEASGRPTSYAMRACDITRTTPRVGDLICQARGAQAGLDSFEKIGEVLAARTSGGGALPMHCDVVVAVDAGGFDAIGGNVLQSVTLRRMSFAHGSSLIDSSYLPSGCSAAQTGCVDRHMSRQPWSLLLQWR